jgi:5-hydroxyisourate hydrolase
MNRISTHILDLGRGKPAQHVPVSLERQDAASSWSLLASCHTDQDGRCPQLLANADDLRPGIYRLRFDIADYFASQETETLYPEVQIAFLVRAGEKHFHIPLLLSPNGYTTYRGS